MGCYFDESKLVIKKNTSKKLRLGNEFVSRKQYIPSHCSATGSRQYEIARIGEKFILYATWMKAPRESNRRKQEGRILFLFSP